MITNTYDGVYKLSQPKRVTTKSMGLRMKKRIDNCAAAHTNAGKLAQNNVLNCNENMD